MESPPMLLPTAHVAQPTPRTRFVHRLHIFLKAHYFLFFSAFGILYPILNITLRGRGLSNSELSYINIIIPFLVFFTNPLLGFVADQSRRYLLTFNFLLILTTGIYIVLFMLPSIKSRNIHADLIFDHKQGYTLQFCASQEIATTCASRSECGCSYQANCVFLGSSEHQNHAQAKTFSMQFSMSENNSYKEAQESVHMSEPALCGVQYQIAINQAVDNYTKYTKMGHFPTPLASSSIASCDITCSITHYCHGSRYANQSIFIILYSLLFILGTNFMSNAVALGASIGIASLFDPSEFGQQRLFGTFGFGVGAFVASRVYAQFHSEHVYIIMFSVTTVICIFITSFIHIHPRKPGSNTSDDENDQGIEMSDLSQQTSSTLKKKKVKSGLSELFLLLKKVDVIIFLLHTLICGMSYAALDPYLYLYIDEIAACESHSIIGWMSLVASLGEIAAFFVASYVLKFLGTSISSIVVLLAFVVRFGGYYFIHQPYLLIIMETMHFFNFGILYVLIVQKANSIAPPGLSGTLQGVSLGILFGLGRGVGLLIASLIYRYVQRRVLFLIFAIFNLSAAGLYLIYFIMKKLRSKSTVKGNVDESKVASKTDIQLSEDPLIDRDTTKNFNQPTGRK